MARSDSVRCRAHRERGVTMIPTLGETIGCVLLPFIIFFVALYDSIRKEKR